MKKIFTLFAALTYMMSMFALTYNVTVPAGTKACYIAGDMNGWSHVEMEKVDETHYKLDVASADKTMGYKYCSGPDWAYVECGADDSELANRVYSENDEVAKWRAVYNPNDVPTPPTPGETKDITVKALVPAAWTNTITAWVWPTGGAGKEVVPTKEGDWYVYTENCAELNIIFKNGEGWNGDANQTVDMKFTENTCISIAAGSGKATYTVVDCEGGVVTPPTPEDPTAATYYVVGSFNNWTNPDPKYAMTEEGGVYTKILTLEAGECQIKVTNGTWDDGGNWGYDALNEVPAGVTRNNDGNIVFTLAEAGDVKVTFNGTNVTVSGNFYVSTEPVEVKYVLMGLAGDWTTGVELALNESNTDFTEYQLLGQTIAEGDAVKVVTLTNGAATAWCGNVEEGSVAVSYDENGNIVLAPGKYDFYFKPDSDIIYIGASAPSGVENVTVEGKAVKVMRNGQMCILRDGIYYNMLGQIAE